MNPTTYHIYQPLEGVLNTLCLRGHYQYEQVASVKASSLEEAFILSQNEFNDDYAVYGHRSTSVGDIFEHESKYYMIMPVGFAEVPQTVVQYIDWSYHQKDPTDAYNAEDAA